MIDQVIDPKLFNEIQIDDDSTFLKILFDTIYQ